MISILLPVHNGAAFLARAIESIRRQTHAEWELLILDDGSRDESLAIAQRFSEPRVHVYSDSTQRGLAARLNQGIDLARGRYIARIDHDDVAYPERLAKQHAFLERHPDVDLLGTRALLVHEDDSPHGLFPFRGSHEEICARPWNGFYLPHPTWMAKAEWFRRFRYAEPETVRAEDQELLLRAYDKSRFACLPEVLLGYRVNNVPAKKLFRARINLAKAQWHVNMQSSRPHYAALGGGLFLGKAILDLVLNPAVRGRAAGLRESHPASRDEITQWNRLLQSLGSKAGP